MSAFIPTYFSLWFFSTAVKKFLFDDRFLWSCRELALSHQQPSPDELTKQQAELSNPRLVGPDQKLCPFMGGGIIFPCLPYLYYIILNLSLNQAFKFDLLWIEYKKYWLLEKHNHRCPISIFKYSSHKAEPYLVFITICSHVCGEAPGWCRFLHRKGHKP